MNSFDRNETNSASNKPSYIYYGVFLLGGLIPSKTAFDPANPFVGRISMRSIPPPHTVATLIRCFTHAEGMIDPDGLYELYGDASKGTSLSSWADIDSGGSTPARPYALVQSGQDISSSSYYDAKDGINNDPPGYLYYHLYARVGEAPSKAAFNLQEPAIGRILKNHIAPPRCALSVKRCIAAAEKNPIYAFAEMYSDISSCTTVSEEKVFDLYDDKCFGAMVGNPLVLVQPERRPGLHNRPLMMIESQEAPTHLVSENNKKVRVPYKQWLSAPRGEIVDTDGSHESRWKGGPGMCSKYVPAYNVRYNGRSGCMLFLVILYIDNQRR
ncbi:hypothetical protein B0H15DRAFT_917922 [Mycena belliarum]|uniref:Uncharacterized protein n=1 Tax=Mycena belliarum TaxID=1033014 RepID=A0AAD6TQQ2_9AGAR|nr:hypothetical protein B0H15DRAFT_917922 [Mycena belliae]